MLHAENLLLRALQIFYTWHLVFYITYGLISQLNLMSHWLELFPTASMTSELTTGQFDSAQDRCQANHKLVGVPNCTTLSLTLEVWVTVSDSEWQWVTVSDSESSSQDRGTKRQGLHGFCVVPGLHTKWMCDTDNIALLCAKTSRIKNSFISISYLYQCLNCFNDQSAGPVSLTSLLVFPLVLIS